MEEEKNLKVPEYVSDKIGEDYKNWGNRDVIFITAPTGTGKSHFILHIFLKWMVKKGWRMLYLVNRKILKKQIEEELYGEVEDEIFQEFEMYGSSVRNYITVSTYQSIEKGLKGENQGETIKFIRGFACVVYDECHYFYSDSNFNTSTELSYFFLRKEFNHKLQIYISATPDKIRKNMDAYVAEETESFAGQMPQNALFKKGNSRIKEYSLNNIYDYIHLSIFEKIEDMIGTIRMSVCTGKQKWLIFVDNIELGKDLKNKLLNSTGAEDGGRNEYKISDKEVVFLDARYGKKIDTRESVEEIAREKTSSKKVIISTAVMDNGISIHDRDLRNIVILADTKETFIQMLGRKRRDGRKVNLYICKQEIRNFKRRKEHIEEVLEYCNRHWDKLAFINEPYEFQNGEGKVFKKRYIENMGGNALINCWTGLKNQQGMLNELLTNSISAQCIKEFCYSVDGFLIPNMFAILRYRELKIFYKNIIKDLENDEYAFVKRQAEWLDIPEEKLDAVIQDSRKKIFEKNCEILEQEIKEVLDKSMDKKTNIEWKLSISEVLIYFIKRDENFKKSEEDALKKTDRVISKSLFERCVKQAKLPYIMIMKNKNAKKGEDTSYTIVEECENHEK